jgi:5'-3' exonuclease
MGIKGLLNLIRQKFPEEYKTIHISDYAYKKVAIDISLFVFKYKTVNPQTWLTMFINLVACLRKNNVHCIFVYDNGHPEEKELAHAKRSKTREKLQSDTYNLEMGLEVYHSTGEITKEIADFAKKKGNAAWNILTEDINMQFIEQEITKKSNQVVPVTKEDFEKTKELFRILDVPFCDAIGEGEASCSKLCRVGKVDAVLSEDSDVLAYGSPIFLSKIDTSDGTCVEINYNNILKKLGWTRYQFIDLCIMCSTDYNENIPGIGPAKIYQLIDKYKSIDTLVEIGEEEIRKAVKGIPKKTVIDFSILKYQRVREILRHPRAKKINISYCGQPDYEKLQEFLKHISSNLKFERLRQEFSTPKLVFIEDEN